MEICVDLWTGRECCHPPYIQKLMDVSFHISGGVVFEKFRDFPIVDKISWISSAKNRGQGISTFGYFRRLRNRIMTSKIGELVHPKKLKLRLTLGSRMRLIRMR